MRSLIPETQDARTLQDLGLASIQIVHDLKNQLNGLKLYATFLRRRMESSERPTDELEIVAKLIAGIERTSEELTALVRFGRPIELRTQPGVGVDKILETLKDLGVAGEEIHLEIDDASLAGDFDIAALSEAFASITKGALSMRRNGDPLVVHQRRDEEKTAPHVLIEWRSIETSDDDVFRSLRGTNALRIALAAKVIEAHNGTAEQKAGMLRVSLPIQDVDIR